MKHANKFSCSLIEQFQKRFFGYMIFERLVRLYLKIQQQQLVFLKKSAK